MDGIKVQSQEMSHFSHPMTMHQPYANYLDYTPPQKKSDQIYSSSSQAAPSIGFHSPELIEDLQQHRPLHKTMTTYASSTPKKNVPHKKKTRNQYSPQQKDALERSYMDGAYVSSRRREEMAQQLGLSAKQVKVWYQNRRQKEKRRLMKAQCLAKAQVAPQAQSQKVMKVPPSAGSPDSGVQDVFNESNYQRHLIKEEKYSPQKQQQEQVTYSETNKIDPVHKTDYEGKYYPAAAAPTAVQPNPPSHATSSGSASAPSYYSQYDISQAFANYYNNYDYLQQYQYYQYQLMSGGYQSQHYSVDPQEPQTTYYQNSNL